MLLANFDLIFPSSYQYTIWLHPRLSRRPPASTLWLHPEERAVAAAKLGNAISMRHGLQPCTSTTQQRVPSRRDIAGYCSMV